MSYAFPIVIIEELCSSIKHIWISYLFREKVWFHTLSWDLVLDLSQLKNIFHYRNKNRTLIPIFDACRQGWPLARTQQYFDKWCNKLRELLIHLPWIYHSSLAKFILGRITHDRDLYFWRPSWLHCPSIPQAREGPDLLLPLCPLLISLSERTLRYWAFQIHSLGLAEGARRDFSSSALHIVCFRASLAPSYHAPFNSFSFFSAVKTPWSTKFLRYTVLWMKSRVQIQLYI